MHMVRNSTTAWGWLSIIFHWIGAAAILTLLIHGWWMTHLATGSSRVAYYAWHAALGYDLLALLVIRLLWRWMNPVPQYPGDFKPWERWSARLGHVGLYVLMFGATIAGWAMAGTGRRTFEQDLFGLKIPLIYVSQDRAMHGLLEDTHKILSYLLAALIVIHLIGALRHHLIKKNDVLRRMLWSASRGVEAANGRQAAE
jgi:cytochrome b561